MSISVIQKIPNTEIPKRGGSALTITTSVPDVPITVGSYSFAFHAQHYNPSELPVFSDSGGNTWERIISYANGNDIVSIGRCKVVTGGNIIITATLGIASYQTMGVIEVSSDADLTVTDTATGSGSSTTPATAQLDATGAQLYLGVINWPVGGLTVTPPSGWTEIHKDETYTDTCHDSAYLIDSGNKTPTWALSSSVAWVAVSVALAESIVTDVYSGKGIGRGIGRGIMRMVKDKSGLFLPEKKILVPGWAM